MCSEKSLDDFKDIFEPRRREMSNFMYMSRSLSDLVSPYYQLIKYTPTQLKLETLKSRTIQSLIDTLSDQNLPKSLLYNQIKVILDEIGFNKQYNVIRWFGLAIIKICLKVSSGIFVNETAILNLRSKMGQVPIVYVPSHRSYADFILMSYICFTYDIEIPAIAAGMDFHGMWGMGKLLRDTGAFFMRRSFNGDRLYWDTFQEYVYTILVKGQQGIEFFIEGTRSRSGKSLVPKIGLLSMILKAHFKSDVPDIWFVPINFSYDRVLEERLFAFELLGVPKPKESTMGFFKSLNIVNENYGSIYVDFGQPISTNSFFAGKTDKTLHNMSPKYLNIYSKEDKNAMQMLANDIVYSQQKHCMISTFNLIALVLMNNLIAKKEALNMLSLTSEVLWIKSVIEQFGAQVSLKDENVDICNSLTTHKNLVCVGDDDKIQLISNEIVLNDQNMSKLKAHAFSEQTMTAVVPYFMLQIYVNHTLHYFVNASIVVVIINLFEPISKDELKEHFHFLRKLFAKEFIFADYYEDKDLNETVNQTLKVGLISETGSNYYKGSNGKLAEFLISLLQPFLSSYYAVLIYLEQVNKDICFEKDVLMWCQSKLEQMLCKKEVFIHPYSLCLESLSNCLQSLMSLGVLQKDKSVANIPLKIDKAQLSALTVRYETFLPKMYSQKFKVLMQLNNKL